MPLQKEQKSWVNRPKLGLAISALARLTPKLKRRWKLTIKILPLRRAVSDNSIVSARDMAGGLGMKT